MKRRIQKFMALLCLTGLLCSLLSGIALSASEEDETLWQKAQEYGILK